MTELDKLKHSLASSDVWMQIKQIELDKIMRMSEELTDPLIIKGMLRTIKDIEDWRKGDNNAN